MINGLIALLVVVIVVGIVAVLIKMLIDLLPIDDKFKQIAVILLMVIAILIILAKALPLLGVSIG